MKNFLKLFLIHLILFTSAKVFSQWSVSGNFGGGFVNSIHIKSSSVFAGTSTQGVFRSDNNGLNWTQFNSGLGNSLSIQCISSNVYFVFAGTASGGIFNSIDGGLNWIQSNQGISQLNIKAMITDDSSMFAGCIFAGIFRSTNNGNSWYRFGLGEGDLLSSLLYNGDVFLVGLNGGMYRTTNYGLNWSLAFNGITNLDIKCLAQSENKTYCGTFGGGVFVSENNGVLWTPESEGLKDMRIQVLTSDGLSMFAGTLGKGVHYFNNISGNWIPVNDGLTDSNIVSIAMNEEFIFAGSSRGKVWRRPLNEIVTDINDPISIHPAHHHLFQNYPNPFNPVTNISFYISERNFVSLKVFDNSGKEVSEIFSGFLPEGEHTKIFNGENFAAGVYYYRLSSEKFSDVKKFVLVK